MKKFNWLLSLSVLIATPSFAADMLNGTQWKTIDDTTGKPKAIVEFKQHANGTLSATVKELLDPTAAKTCSKCTGALKDKPMVGLTIAYNLKATSNGKYEGGTILDPKSGSTYNLKGEIAEGGSKLALRGYKGISVLGRNQTWQRVK